MERLNGIGCNKLSPVPEAGEFLFADAARADFFEEPKQALCPCAEGCDADRKSR
jgi:hypothetical protein